MKYSITIVLKKNMNQAKPMVFLQSFYELLPSSWWPQAAFGRWIVGLPSRSLLPICIGLDKRTGFSQQKYGAYPVASAWIGHVLRLQPSNSCENAVLDTNKQTLGLYFEPCPVYVHKLSKPLTILPVMYTVY